MGAFFYWLGVPLRVALSAFTPRLLRVPRSLWGNRYNRSRGGEYMSKYLVLIASLNYILTSKDVSNSLVNTIVNNGLLLLICVHLLYNEHDSMNVRLSKEQKIKIANTKDMYRVMQGILLRENKLGRTREHFWVASLNTANYIINIELVALGSMNKAVITPSDVFSIAFQKRAAYVVLVHNHPSGETKPSSADLELTKKLYHVGKYHNCPVYDHLIIAEKKFLSMREKGIIKEIDKEPNPLFFIEDYFDLLKRQTDLQKEKATEIAKGMLLLGDDVKKISVLTGLSAEEVEGLR